MKVCMPRLPTYRLIKPHSKILMIDQMKTVKKRMGLPRSKNHCLIKMAYILSKFILVFAIQRFVGHCDE